MEQVDYDRLVRLVDEGDAEAAQSLMVEANRRGETDVYKKAANTAGVSRTPARRYTLKRTRSGRREPNFDTELNEQQRAVVQAGPGPMLVVAGAGSGKTRTLTYRVARLLKMGVEPERVLLLTFTNRAAREMTRRVADLVEVEAQRIWSGTFHHIGHRILRRHAELLGYPESFSIMDSEDVTTLMGVCISDLGVSMATGPQKRRFPKGGVIHDIYSRAVNTGRSIIAVMEEDHADLVRARLVEPVAAVVKRYIERKQEMGLMDYDDLLINWRRLFEEHPKIHQRYAQQFEHVLVDEYQDTNHLQSSIVDLCGSHHRNIMVVGDDCQSIYSFRGADHRHILAFPERYPESNRFLLETNYRSTPQVLALANRSIQFNQHRFDKVLRPVRDPGMTPAVVPCRDLTQQAQFVTERILELHEGGMALKNMAVLYRAHYQSVELQLELQQANVPFTIRSGMRFFEQAHVKDVISHLRFIHNPRDELSFFRIVKLCQGIGDRFAQKLWRRLCEEPDPLEALVPEVGDFLPEGAGLSFKRFCRTVAAMAEPIRWHQPAELIGLVIDGDYADYVQTQFRNAENRMGDLEQLAQYAAQFDSIDAFLNDLALINQITGEDVEEAGETNDYVILSSVHQAKGLEWPVVFVTSLWDGGFPTARGQETVEAEEEERRLFYVAVTRAMDQLYLTYPTSRRGREGWRRVQRASPFLSELEDRESFPPRNELTEIWALSES